MTSTRETYEERSARIHAEEVARGEHDAQCEHGPRLVTVYYSEPRVVNMFICHCSKRRREAAGQTRVPELEWLHPICTGCNGETEHDGDGLVCRRCRVQWSSDGASGEFTDEYGDLGRPVTDAPVAGGVL